jgi:glycosyltransferase involved in cell wall biosynthesis
MKIAYVAPYQGQSLLNSRPIIRNRSLASSIKIELLANLLATRHHHVEIISPGEIVERKLNLYKSFSEKDLFHPDIPIHYSSSLPIRYVNGVWSSLATLALFKARHRVAPYQLMIIYNLHLPQIMCANYAIHALNLPVILAFVDLEGGVSVEIGLAHQCFLGLDARRLLANVSGCMAVSPHLLSQLPSNIPKLLLRGVVGEDLMVTSERTSEHKNKWVLFSGNFHKVKGIEQLIVAWQQLKLSDWELHITGYGELEPVLRSMAAKCPNIIFHGLLARQELVRLMSSAAICVNPHAVSQTPGNVFAFKIIEYLAAGAHVISTPMGILEKEIERGITYLHDNKPETIAEVLRNVIYSDKPKQKADHYVRDKYGPISLSKSVDELLQAAMEVKGGQPSVASTG